MEALPEAVAHLERFVPRNRNTENEAPATVAAPPVAAPPVAAPPVARRPLGPLPQPAATPDRTATDAGDAAR